jgi:integrase
MKRRLNMLMVKNAKPKKSGKPKKHADGGGLYLLVSEKGKYWRYNYRFMGKGKTLALGVYPDVNLSAARIAHQEARELLNRSIDPNAYRKINKIAKSEGNSFEAVGREWFLIWRDDNSESHAIRVMAKLENDVFPFLGKRIIGDIEPPDILIVLKRIVSRGSLEVAHRTRQVIGQIFRYAVAIGKAKRDQTADLKGALRPYRKKHFPAITDPIEVGHLLRVIDDYTGSLIIRCAFRLSPLVMLRPSELSGARWQEIDFGTATWTIPVARMKARTYIKEENATVHIVPLSRQALDILSEVQQLTGHYEHVFTGARNRKKPMNPSSINTALKRLGYQETMKAHSFRAMASTMLNQMGFNPDAIERQLAHKDKNAIRAAYNRAEYLDERRDMMQKWADYLDKLRYGADVIPIARGNR